MAAAQDPAIHVVPQGGISSVVALAGGGPAIVRETSAVVANAVLHPVAGARVLAATWDEIDVTSGSSTPWFALSLDGRKFHEAQETSHDILLRYRRFDPLLGEPEVEPALRAAPGSRLWIVQYWTQGLEEYRDVVRQLGGEVHLFLANNANVVEADAAAVEAIRAEPFVRWVGPFHPAYKLDEVLVAEQKGAAVAPGMRRVNVLTMRRGADGHAPVDALIAAIGGRVASESPETHLLSAELTPDQTLELARADGVQWIDLWSPPENDMDIAREFHGANYVETNAGFTGQGVRAEVLDGGCDVAHPDLAGALLHGQNAASDHGTCTSGIVFGTGSGNAAGARLPAVGSARGRQLHVHDEPVQPLLRPPEREPPIQVRVPEQQLGRRPHDGLHERVAGHGPDPLRLPAPQHFPVAEQLGHAELAARGVGEEHHLGRRRPPLQHADHGRRLVDQRRQHRARRGRAHQAGHRELLRLRPLHGPGRDRGLQLDQLLLVFSGTSAATPICAGHAGFSTRCGPRDRSATRRPARRCSTTGPTTRR